MDFGGPPLVGFFRTFDTIYKTVFGSSWHKKNFCCTLFPIGHVFFSYFSWPILSPVSDTLNTEPIRLFALCYSQAIAELAPLHASFCIYSTAQQGNVLFYTDMATSLLLLHRLLSGYWGIAFETHTSTATLPHQYVQCFYLAGLLRPIPP